MFEALFKCDLRTLLEGDFVYLSRIPGEVRFVLFVGFLASAWLLYREVGSKVSPLARRALPIMRSGTYALVFFILGSPAIEVISPGVREIYTAVLVDTSLSMSIEDASTEGGGKKQARLSAAIELLGEGAPEGGGLLAEIGRSSRCLLYGFDRSPRRLAGIEELRPAGGGTNVYRALRDVDAELARLPLAAVVMLTDGCRNEGGGLEEAARIPAARGVPLFVVGIGDPSAARDYEVVRVVAPRRVRRNAEVELQVTVRHAGAEGPFELRVRRGDNVVLSSREEPAKGTDIKVVRLVFTPDHEGSATYVVEIPPAEFERTAANNSARFAIDIQDERLPVLYVEGSPRLEYRFLRRAMFMDPEFRVVGMLRLARDRFLVQGAGAGEEHLQQGFPSTRERLFAYQAVILGDIEAAHFTREQMELLEEFVGSRGGGLLMLGGVNSFGQGGYAGTPIEKMLPVALAPRERPYSDETFAPYPTREGLAHPVMMLSQNPGQNRSLWEKVPPLIGWTPVGSAKAGAAVLLTKGPGGPSVLAVQNYGAGRTAAFTSGGSWYWQVSMPASDEFHERFWKQLVRWLVSGAREQLTVSTSRDIYARGEGVFIRATVLGKDLRPVNDASVVATVTGPSGNPEEIPMNWILSEEGVYQCRYVGEETGPYTVSVRVEGWGEAKAATAGFLVAEESSEFADSALKEQALRAMAESTGGRYFALADARGLAAELERAIARASSAERTRRTIPLWDMPALYVALMGLVCAEWLVRRRAGLA